MGLRDREAAAQYQRLYRQGHRSPKVIRSLASRILARTDRVYGQANGPDLGTCWEWMGARNSAGYGLVKHEGKVKLVHRLTLEIAMGRPIRPGFYANHKCDNPPCNRPRHLYEGTPEENVADCISRGRHKGFETRSLTAQEAADEWAAALDSEFAGE